MRSVLLPLFVAVVACDPAAPTPRTTTTDRGPRDHAIAGTYRLTPSGRAKAVRWARTLKKSSAVPYIETIHVAGTGRGDELLVELGAGSKGPYALAPAGKSSWIYPLKKGWKVVVTHRPRRDRIKVRVGPVIVFYRRVP